MSERTEEANERRAEYQRQTVATPRKTNAPYLTRKQAKRRELQRREAAQPRLFT
jgi:hypothetical protein